MVVAIVVVIGLTLVLGIAIFKDYQNKKAEFEGDVVEEKGIDVDSYRDPNYAIRENTYTPRETTYTYTPLKPSKKVIVIAIVVLLIFIAAGVIFALALADIDDNYIPAAVGIALGCAMEGIVIFAVLYALGHILKNNEEMNDKMNDLIKK